MKLLIVDDDCYVLEDIKESLDFIMLGISEVYTSLNIHQAMDILSKQTIDIVISDIDMPGGNGLELLSYIRTNFPKIQTFFITCHADFNFAKQAIRLGCLDYMLKPLDYKEIETIIRTAISNIETERKSEDLKTYQNYWFKHQPRLIEQFWKDIINRKIPLSKDFLEREADHRNIPFQADVEFLPILVCIQYPDNILTVEETSILSFGIKNIGEEFLTKWGELGHFFEISQRNILGMFPLPKDSIEASQEAIFSKLQEYVSLCHNYLFGNISCYVGTPIIVADLPGIVEKLRNLNDTNMAYFNHVFYISKISHDTFTSPHVDMSSWIPFIKKGYSKRVSAEIHQLFDAMIANKTMTYNFCMEFQQDFLQVIYQILRENGMKAHLILEDEKILTLFKDSAHSSQLLLNWIDAVLQKVGGYFIEMDKTELQLQRAIGYIMDNLQKDISREEVASHVFLNPDYLDRLFKKQYNMSVSKYILQDRMKLAKQLLAETNLSISTIGTQLGYNNLSNFSSAFKKIVKQNPAEFRKNKC